MNIIIKLVLCTSVIEFIISTHALRSATECIIVFEQMNYAHHN